jgi:hypothetical protein
MKICIQEQLWLLKVQSLFEMFFFCFEQGSIKNVKITILGCHVLREKYVNLFKEFLLRSKKAWKLGKQKLFLDFFALSGQRVI